MAVNLSIEGAPDAIADALRARAAANHRSLQRELLAIVAARVFLETEREAAELDIERLDIDLPSTVRIGETFALTAHGAAYLWMAGHLRAPIVTFDARLAAAAKTYLSQLGPSG
jgi:plasmid stability protein